MRTPIVCYRLPHSIMVEGGERPQPGVGAWSDDNTTSSRIHGTQLMALVENSPEAVFIKDTEGRFEFVNPTAAALFGLDPSDVHGRFDADFFATSDAAEIREIDSRVMETGVVDTRETAREIGGVRRVFLEHTYPYRDPNGTTVGVMGTSREITERTHREADLQRRHDRLDEFTALISHDVLNPLAVAQGRLALAQAESDSEHLDAIGVALDRIEAMVADTLQLARQGEVVTDPEPVHITALVANCWAMIGADDATLRLDDEFTLVADPDRLQHVFENLFRNSVVHGGPDVTVHIGRLEDGFYVSDDGPGIPEVDRELVFAPGHKSVHGGTGFGLTIVHRIADAHGWTVDISENDTGGARFEFSDVALVDGD